MTDATSGDEVAQLLQSSNDECALCDLHGRETVFLYSLEDYAATNLDEDVPARYVELCSHHYEMIREQSTLVDQSEVPGLGQ